MARLENLPLGWSQTPELVRVLINLIYLSNVTHAQPEQPSRERPGGAALPRHVS